MKCLNEWCDRDMEFIDDLECDYCEKEKTEVPGFGEITHQELNGFIIDETH